MKKKMVSRRRSHSRRYLISALSAFSAAALLLLAIVSFITPAPPDRTSHLLKTAALVRKELIDVEGFRVPVTNHGSAGKDLWTSSLSKFYYGCSNSSKKFPTAVEVTSSNRYLMIATSGGLNQQRTGAKGDGHFARKFFQQFLQIKDLAATMTIEWSHILLSANSLADSFDGMGHLHPQIITDAVVAARILNATLVVPKLDQKSFWKDASDFEEIFDVDWFISFLSNDVKIIKQVPRKGGKIMGFYNMRVPRKCTQRCYQNRVLPVLLKKHVVQLSKFDYRLANKLETDLQKLRCRVNYHALKFTNPINEMGKKLTQRMRDKSRLFIALHLRFEPDMLAFSGCYYGGGEKERTELGAIRRRWKTLHTPIPEKERRHGKCPLTPEEVGLMLRALGFGKDVHIYVASGEVYGGEETLAPLKALFPNFYSKETLASKEELMLFSSFSSRMAALDFIVCDESDVFVTNNNGNMARMLAGRRRYFGHKRTIRPNAKKLYSLFMNRSNMTWEAFASKVRTYQKGFMGEPNEVRPGRGEFHENPSTCICGRSELQAVPVIKRQSPSGSKSGKNNTNKVVGEPTDDQYSDEEPDWSDLDYMDNRVLPQHGRLSNGTELDYYLFTKSEDPELEDILSD